MLCVKSSINPFTDPKPVCSYSRRVTAGARSGIGLSYWIENSNDLFYHQPAKMKQIVELMLPKMDSFQQKIEANQEEIRTSSEISGPSRYSP
jgi:hypothetical protein